MRLAGRLILILTKHRYQISNHI